MIDKTIKTRSSNGKIKYFDRYSPPIEISRKKVVKSVVSSSSVIKKKATRPRNTAVTGSHNKWEEYRVQLNRLILSLLRFEHFIALYIPEGTIFSGSQQDFREIIPVVEILRAQYKILKTKERICALFQQLTSENSSHRKWEESLCRADEDGLVDLSVVLCSVCGKDDEEGNDIVICDKAGCFRAYHQLCLEPALQLNSSQNNNEKSNGNYTNICRADTNNRIVPMTDFDKQKTTDKNGDITISAQESSSVINHTEDVDDYFDSSCDPDFSALLTDFEKSFSNNRLAYNLEHNDTSIGSLNPVTDVKLSEIITNDSEICQDWFCWQCECITDCLHLLQERLELSSIIMKNITAEINTAIGNATVAANVQWDILFFPPGLKIAYQTLKRRIEVATAEENKDHNRLHGLKVKEIPVSNGKIKILKELLNNVKEYCKEAGADGHSSSNACIHSIEDTDADSEEWDDDYQPADSVCSSLEDSSSVTSRFAAEESESGSQPSAVIEQPSVSNQNRHNTLTGYRTEDFDIRDAAQRVLDSRCSTQYRDKLAKIVNDADSIPSSRHSVSDREESDSITEADEEEHDIDDDEVTGLLGDAGIEYAQILADKADEDAYSSSQQRTSKERLRTRTRRSAGQNSSQSISRETRNNEGLLSQNLTDKCIARLQRGELIPGRVVGESKYSSSLGSNNNSAQDQSVPSAFQSLVWIAEYEDGAMARLSSAEVSVAVFLYDEYRETMREFESNEAKASQQNIIDIEGTVDESNIVTGKRKRSQMDYAKLAAEMGDLAGSEEDDEDYTC